MELHSHYKRRIDAQRHTVGDWTNCSVNTSLLYSYRSTVYDADTFPAHLHYHDYYELIVLEEGDIRYVCESLVYHPKKGDIILIPPEKFHMSAINGAKTRYCRHVFYFHPDAFDAYGCSCLVNFARDVQGGIMISLSESQKTEALRLLHVIRSELGEQTDTPEYALGLSYLLRFFYLLNGAKVDRAEPHGLPPVVIALKEYIDGNFATVSTVKDVAEHFFYSREHTSRLFKKYFDISISDYIMQRKILESRRLILSGASITDTAYAVGFNSMSAFISSFRRATGMSPSEYKRLNL